MRSVGGRPRRSRDVVVFLKFSDRASYDLLRRKADLERWAGERSLGGPRGSLVHPKVGEGDWHSRPAVGLVSIPSWKSGAVRESSPRAVKGV